MNFSHPHTPAPLLHLQFPCLMRLSNLSISALRHLRHNSNSTHSPLHCPHLIHCQLALSLRLPTIIPLAVIRVPCWQGRGTLPSLLANKGHSYCNAAHCISLPPLPRHPSTMPACPSACQPHRGHCYAAPVPAPAPVPACSPACVSLTRCSSSPSACRIARLGSRASACSREEQRGRRGQGEGGVA